MTADELARLAASGTQGWVSTDHVTWVLKQLNDMQNDTMLLCPNVVVNIHNEMTRKAKLFNLGTLKRLVFALNVGQRDGKTFIGGPQNGGNHWVLVDVELRPFMKIIYCDTLAWQPPPDIIDVVNDFVRYIPQVGMYKKSHLVLAHSPGATNWQGQEGAWRCRNYSLQSCTDICGVITLVNAAVVTSALYSNG